MQRSLLRNISFGSLSLIVVVLVCATFVEKYRGAGFVLATVYHSRWFVALWALSALSGLCYILQQRVKRLGAAFLLHISFLVVLAGGLLTWLTATRGAMYVAVDAPPASMYETADGALLKLPFKVSLESFSVERSGGVPVDYVASLVLQRADGGNHNVGLSMNNPSGIDGYRLYIGSYEGGAVKLLGNYDPWGTPLTYVGYAMLLLSLVWLLCDRGAGFRAALARLRGVRVDDAPREHTVAAGLGRAQLPLALLLFLAIGYAGLRRWLQTGCFPASNGYEALLLLAWCALLAGLLLHRRHSAALPYSLVLALLASVVFAVGGASSSAAPSPVLRTPLLAVHVVQVIIAYVLLAAMAVNAVVALWHWYFRCDEEKVAHLATVGRVLLYPAVALLITGIFTGAVWANLSWGRYWGWDPKEVWALVTLLVCAAAFHTRSLPFLSRPLSFHIFSLVAFVAVLFTYFGVNFLLGGLHSYA